MIVSVDTATRLHLGLLNLSGLYERRYGGIGLMLDVPRVRVSAERSPDWRLVPHDAMTGRDIEDVRDVLKRLEMLAPDLKVRVRVESMPPPHVGFGTKTAALLAVVTAVDLLNCLDLDRASMQRISGRGGTSGIGVHGYYHGGFIIDGGHKASRKEGYAPSSAASSVAALPSLLSKIHFPENWHIALLLPEGVRVEGAVEKTFFTDNCPIPGVESEAAIALCFGGIVPAIVDADIQALKTILGEFNRTGFKSREIRHQGTAVSGAMEYIAKESKAAVGMSSLGPLVYVIDEDVNLRETIGVVQAAAELFKGVFYGVSRCEYGTAKITRE